VGSVGSLGEHVLSGKLAEAWYGRTDAISCQSNAEAGYHLLPIPSWRKGQVMPYDPKSFAP
jgi:hypothetical protein